jgi:hypothetical protein
MDPKTGSPTTKNHTPKTNNYKNPKIVEGTWVATFVHSAKIHPTQNNNKKTINTNNFKNNNNKSQSLSNNNKNISLQQQRTLTSRKWENQTCYRDDNRGYAPVNPAPSELSIHFFK